MRAEGPPEAIKDEPSCSFLMKGSKEHPSAEIMVGIWEVPARQPALQAESGSSPIPEAGISKHSLVCILL